MLSNILRGRARKFVAENENQPASALSYDVISAANIRALATEAALAVSVDASPAVLVSLYDHASRTRDRIRRSA